MVGTVGSLGNSVCVEFSFIRVEMGGIVGTVRLMVGMVVGMACLVVVVARLMVGVTGLAVGTVSPATDDWVVGDGIESEKGMR